MRWTTRPGLLRTVAGDADVDHGPVVRVLFDPAVERRGRRERQRGTGAAPPDRRQPLRTTRKAAVPERIDAGVELVHALAQDEAPDAAWMEAESDEVGSAQEPFLPLGLRDDGGPRLGDW